MNGLTMYAQKIKQIRTELNLSVAKLAEKINIQPIGNKSKPYQVKQVRNIILKYQLGDDINV